MDSHSCFLSNPHLPIITEIDHKAGLCLCSRCTCGLHKCPSTHFFSTLTSKYKTSYNQDFRKHSHLVRSPITPTQVQRVKSQPFFGQSTQKTEFKPIPPEYRVEKVASGRFTPSPFRLQQTTSYNNDFVNFGVIKDSPLAKKRGDAVRSVGKFQDQTTYKEAFPVRSPEKMIRGASAGRIKKYKRQVFIGESSHKRDYIKYSKYLPVELVGKRNKANLKLSSAFCVPTAFVTTSQKDYSPSTPLDMSIIRSSHKKFL
jgi:hypothetical protein